MPEVSITANLLGEHYYDLVGGVAVNAPLTTWPDQSGTGHPMTGTATVRAGGIEFDGIDDFMASATGSFTGQHWTAYLALHPLNKTAQEAYATIGSSMLVQQYVGAPTLYDGSVIRTGANLAVSMLDRMQILCISSSPTGVIYRINGYEDVSAAVANSALTGFTLGKYVGGGGLFAHMLVKGFIIYSAEHDITQRNTVDNHLRTRLAVQGFGDIATSRHLIVVEGDSIAYGLGASQNQLTWDRVAMSNAVQPYDLLNVAAPSRRVSHVVAGNARLNEILNGHTGFGTVLVLLVGSNDLNLDNASAQSVFDSTSSFCNNIKNDNPELKIIIAGVPYRGAAKETQRQSLRTLFLAVFDQPSGYDLVSTGATFADFYIDFDAAISTGDTIHPDDAGNDVMSVPLRDSLRCVLPVSIDPTFLEVGIGEESPAVTITFSFPIKDPDGIRATADPLEGQFAGGDLDSGNIDISVSEDSTSVPFTYIPASEGEKIISVTSSNRPWRTSTMVISVPAAAPEESGSSASVLMNSAFGFGF